MAAKKTKPPTRTNALPVGFVIIHGKDNILHEHNGVIQTQTGPAMGLSEADSGVIAINTSEAVSLHNVKDTVLHECIHIIDHGAKIGLTEKQVHRLAVCILDMMWSNPTLAAWLCQRNMTTAAFVSNTPNKPPKPKKKRAPRTSKSPMGFLGDTNKQISQRLVVPAKLDLQDYPDNHLSLSE